MSFFGVGSPQITGPVGDKIQIIKHCFPCKGEFCENYNKGVVCLYKLSKIHIEGAVKKPYNEVNFKYIMKAFILAAGVSRRLYPHTYDTPKCLLKVGGSANH